MTLENLVEELEHCINIVEDPVIDSICQSIADEVKAVISGRSYEEVLISKLAPVPALLAAREKEMLFVSTMDGSAIHHAITAVEKFI